MSVYSKSIHVLEQSNNSLKKELAAEETKIGFLYLDDAVCSEEDSARYSELKAEFQQLMGTLAEIKSLETKKRELADDIDKVKAELAGLVAKESGLMLTLGIALYGQNGSQSVPSFASAYEEASRFAEKIAALKTQSEQMTQSLELQNVFSRVVTKVKINSLSVSISFQQKKLDAALVAGAKSVVEAQDLDEGLKCPAYETCVAFKNEWNRERIQLEALQDELQNVDISLADCGKKSLIQGKADAKNSEIEDFAFQTGHAFDKKYITRDGETLAEFPAKYAAGLSAVLEIRARLASVNRRLDILKYSEQIDASDRNREAMEKEVSANEEKISRLTSRNSELSLRLEENAAAMKELCAHREAVEKEEGVTIDDLLALGETAFKKSEVGSTGESFSQAVELARQAGDKAAEFAGQAGDSLKKAAVVTGEAVKKAAAATGEAARKAADATEKAAVKAAEKAKTVVKKSASGKSEKARSNVIAGTDDAGNEKKAAEDEDEEKDFLEALNAAKASAAQSDNIE